jgi:hypothetical protein
VLTDRISQDIFERKIDAAFILESPEMKNIIEIPDDIYDYLQTEMNQLNISNEGVISFDVEVGNAVRRRKVTLTIATCKTENDVNSKIERLQKKNYALENVNKK